MGFEAGMSDTIKRTVCPKCGRSWASEQDGRVCDSLFRASVQCDGVLVERTYVAVEERDRLRDALVGLLDGWTVAMDDDDLTQFEGALAQARAAINAVTGET